MKKSELKNIIKECVKEVIFEEGVLSGIITEVAQGLHATTAGTVRSPSVPTHNPKQLDEAKKEVLAAVGRDAYEDARKKFSNPGLFEGTQPLPSGDNKGNALSGTPPHDPGVDISHIPGFGNWGTVANSIK